MTLDPAALEMAQDVIDRWRRMLAVPQPYATDRVAGEPIARVIAAEVLGAYLDSSGLERERYLYRQALEDIAGQREDGKIPDWEFFAVADDCVEAMQERAREALGDRVR